MANPFNDTMIMEGPLSKWTNLVNGWQYRWFVLNTNAGVLSYYTSKEKMMRGDRRGCVKLKGAQVGIDDEDDSTFTITVDNKTFHFQARDSEERQKWLEALQEARDLHTLNYSMFRTTQPQEPSLSEFDRRLAEADAYLQILIDQHQDLEEHLKTAGTDQTQVAGSVVSRLRSLIELVKQTIVCLQMAKQHTLSPLTQPTIFAPDLPVDIGQDALAVVALSEHLVPVSAASLRGQSPNRPTPAISKATASSVDGVITSTVNGPASTSATLSTSSAQHGAVTTTGHSRKEALVPAVSYSSSEDEEFFDTEEDIMTSPRHSREIRRSTNGGEPDVDSADSGTATPLVGQVICSVDDDFDELYDADEENYDKGVGSIQSHGSVISYLLSQVRIGMDLTKITLPTFILEKRSTLEMYADFLAHPDLWAAMGDPDTPRERMVACMRWYLSAFHAGRKSSVAKKPYNPILGEIFQCHWDLPESGAGSCAYQRTEDEVIPVHWASDDSVIFLAEQVSHHPPISAFYAEHRGKRISIDGHIWTKSKFLGLSISVEMIGEAVISLIDHDEEYIITFPTGYGRNILTVPWIELGGKCTITCAKTGYHGLIEFRTKPFYGGKRDQIKADCFAPGEKKSFLTIEGEWNDKMWAKWTDGRNELFIDTKAMAVIKKRVKPRPQQHEYESRRLWEDVTYSLKTRNIESATNAKCFLEQRQRNEARERQERGVKWQTRCFQEVGEHWVYEHPLVKRIERKRRHRHKKEEEEEEQSQSDASEFNQ